MFLISFIWYFDCVVDLKTPWSVFYSWAHRRPKQKIDMNKIIERTKWLIWLVAGLRPWFSGPWKPLNHWTLASVTVTFQHGCSFFVLKLETESVNCVCSINSVRLIWPIGACCWTIHKLHLSNMLHIRKINPVLSNRLDFAPMKTCNEPEELAVPSCLLFCMCI